MYTKIQIILEELMSLNEYKAFGVDKVNKAVLKNFVDSFVKPLKLFFDLF